MSTDQVFLQISTDINHPVSMTGDYNSVEYDLSKMMRDRQMFEKRMRDAPKELEFMYDGSSGPFRFTTVFLCSMNLSGHHSSTILHNVFEKAFR